MSLIEPNKVKHSETIHYLISPDNLVQLIAADLKVDPKQVCIEVVIDGGNIKYEYAPKLEQIKVTVTKR